MLLQVIMNVELQWQERAGALADLTWHGCGAFNGEQGFTSDEDQGLIQSQR